jgi:flagellar biosynthetic protein FliR
MTQALAAFGVPPGALELALLAMARLSGMLFLTPPFGGSAVPGQIRLSIAFALVLPVWPLLGAPAPSTDVLALTGGVARELSLGLAIGFVARMVLSAASFAAELVSTQIGFGLAAVLDPAMGGQVTPLTRLYDWAMLGIFLALDVHHVILGATLESFRVLPLGQGFSMVGGAGAIVAFGARIFSLGLALVAPTLGILLVTNLVLALASRAVPQLSLMVVGWPVTVLAGLVVLVGNVDLMSGVVAREMRGLEAALIGILRSFADGR